MWIRSLEIHRHWKNAKEVEGRRRSSKKTFWLCPSMFHHLIWYFHYNHEMHNIHFDFTDKNRKYTLRIVVFTEAAWIGWKKLMGCWVSNSTEFNSVARRHIPCLPQKEKHSITRRVETWRIGNARTNTQRIHGATRKRKKRKQSARRRCLGVYRKIPMANIYGTI